MDHDGWYAFGRTQSLGAHDFPKLGVAATVKRLEVAADSAGVVYFHNVRVNGILPKRDAPSLWSLLTLLNSRLLDWVFRRGATEHANGYYAANKQFIAPLPIRTPDGHGAERLDELGRRLHRQATELAEERRGFLAWLSDAIGARPEQLRGSKLLATYDEHSPPDVLEVLQRNQRRLSCDVASRAFRERLEREQGASLDRIGELRRFLGAEEAAADAAVFELYRLNRRQRALIEVEASSA